MAKKILLGVSVTLLALILLFCLVVVMQPSTYAIARATTVGAPAAEIFPLVNDLRAWESWSPWSDLDPQAKVTFADTTVGQGASMAWSGNDQVGEGTMTILESRPDEIVQLEQAFVRPMEGKAQIIFKFAPDDHGTKVIMAMHGNHDFMGKAVCLFMDMDAMIGKDFDKSLLNLKTLAENKESQPERSPAESAPPEAKE